MEKAVATRRISAPKDIIVAIALARLGISLGKISWRSELE
jgi:hypothetical protein